MFLPFLPMLPTQILLNNFLYDLAQIDDRNGQRRRDVHVRWSQRWNIGLVRNFILIGPVSSVYDFLTFYVLLRVFHFSEVSFHTGWFVESLATQTLVLFVIRTAGRPWRHRPSVPLTVTTLTVVVIGGVLPYTPLAATFRFRTTATVLFLVPGCGGLHISRDRRGREARRHAAPDAGSRRHTPETLQWVNAYSTTLIPKA